VGNNRGNKYSHTHKNPKISKKDFFNFSYDEMALYDVPATLKFILAQTKVQKITWIGHSQGTSQFFAAALDKTTKDLVEAHVEKFIALAPIVFMNHLKSPMLSAITQADSLMSRTFDFFGIYEFLPSACQERPKWGDWIFWGCKNGFEWICDGIVPGFNTNSKTDILFDDSKLFWTHYLGGTSVKALIKYGQAIEMKAQKEFLRFDHGAVENGIRYGTESAPSWGNLGGFRIPTALVGAERDEMGSQADVSNLVGALPVGMTSFHMMAGWDHFTFIMPRDPKPLFEVLDFELSQ
jgi:lysosomal acid lipase/cholesteryl ester hydrolase